MSVSPNTSPEHCRRVQGKAEGTQRRCERALGSWEKMSFWCLKQREKYAETASSCRFFPLLFQPRDELQSCFGSPACPLVSPRLPPSLPLPPAAPEGGGAIRYATFLFPARLTGWARKALMFSDRPPLIVGAFLLCLFCEILT